MAYHADLALVLDGAGEKSITTTRSFTSMVLAGNYLAAVATNRQEMIDGFCSLPDIAAGRLDEFEALGRTISKNAEIAKYAFLGSGTHYGLAREAQLKVKEMVLLPVDSYISLDYRHGPKSNVDSAMLVTLFASDAGAGYDGELGRDMKKLQGKLLMIADTPAAADTAGADYRVDLGSGLPDGVRDILYMPAIQFLAYYKSLAVGCDPDNPHNLSYHVDLG
jgi:glucosamine--fructose-6-phosphate aminotransferase (isomerizing)